MDVGQRKWGLIAQYDSAGSIYHACEQVRDAGYKCWDACTPFPVHGLDKAMGLKASKLPWAVLCMGILGGTSIMALMIWVSVYDYPLNIGGKPTWSIPAFIPPTFEMVVLFAALTAAFGMLFINGLPRWNHPLFEVEAFKKVTDDQFFIVVEASDPNFDEANTRALLEGSGAQSVSLVGVDNE